MSTCRGALPPHADCPHGDRCDWDGGPDIPYGLQHRLPTPEEKGRLRDLVEAQGDLPGGPYVPNRADRRRARRRAG